MRRWLALAVLGLLIGGLLPMPVRAATSVQRRLIVVTDGTIYFYRMKDFALVKQVSVPQIQSKRGVMSAAPNSPYLYIAYCGSSACGGSHGHLLAFDLRTDRVAWTQNYTFGIDQPAITPDGQHIYVAEGDDSSGGTSPILNASGMQTGSVNTGTCGHDYLISLDGQYVYLSGKSCSNYNYVHVLSTSTNTEVVNAGPTVNGVRPNTINGKHTLIFTTSVGFCGFQVFSQATGGKLFTVQLPGSCFWPSDAPSHGISLSPNEKQVYVIDGPRDSVFVYDVSGLPSLAPVFVKEIGLSGIIGNESPCQTWCQREGWLLHSLNGKWVMVGDTGDIVNTGTMVRQYHLTPLAETRLEIEVDFSGGLPVATSTRFGLGRVTA